MEIFRIRTPGYHGILSTPPVHPVFYGTSIHMHWCPLRDGKMTARHVSVAGVVMNNSLPDMSR